MKNIKQQLAAVFIFTCMIAFAGCAHRGPQQTRVTSDPVTTTLGYLQLKTPYSKAAFDEGGLPAVKMVMDHKHMRTGKPYPCWNALKPYRRKNLPVSLSISSNNDNYTNDFFSFSKIDRSKFDAFGKDGFFSNTKPAGKGGFQIWQIDKSYKKISQNKFSQEMVALVDISGSMQSKKKLNTLRGLAESNILLKNIYTFSDSGTLKQTNKNDLGTVLPTGNTSLYDNLAEFIKDNPTAELVIITDAKDNSSKTKFADLLKNISQSNQKINVVLTGRDARRDFFQVAELTHGQSLLDLDETGYILEHYLDVRVIE